MINALWPWAALALLGAYHGINPGMGWLFAVARGMQEKSRRAVLSSLLPIAIGHEASIVMVVVAVSARDRRRDRGIDLSAVRWYEDATAMAADPEIDVVVELIGGADGIAQ